MHSSPVALALLFASVVKAQSSVAELVAQLRLAPTEVDRFRTLNDSEFLFDFVNPPSSVGVTTGLAGHTVSASSENFAAVVGNGVSMTIGFLGPCGMNTPHTHPRATEINFSLNTTLRGGVLVENGARFAEIDIAPGSATVFPQGAIHFEMNPSCEPAMFVAAFNNEDPGVDQVAQRFFGLPPDIVGAALGGLGVEEVAGLEALIPDNVAYGAEECLIRCGLERGNQPIAQQQPRVTANAFPAGITTKYFPYFEPTTSTTSSSTARAATSPAAAVASSASTSRASSAASSVSKASSSAAAAASTSRATSSSASSSRAASSTNKAASSTSRASSAASSSRAATPSSASASRATTSAAVTRPASSSSARAASPTAPVVAEPSSASRGGSEATATVTIFRPSTNNGYGGGVGPVIKGDNDGNDITIIIEEGPTVIEGNYPESEEGYRSGSKQGYYPEQNSGSSPENRPETDTTTMW